MKRLLTGLLFVLLPQVGLARAHGPLTAEQATVFHGSPEDPPPEKLDATRKDLEGRHYLSGDERHLDLFHDTVKDLGGGYMGVGSDQAYMFAAWQKAELVFLSDYDPWIKWEHMAHVAFFEAAPDIAGYRRLWSRKGNKEALALLRERYKDDPLERKVVFVYARAAHHVARRLGRLHKWAKASGVGNFVSDPVQYQYIRDLVVEGRVRPMQCNLLDAQGMKGVADVSRKLGVPMRVIYPSNAEQYWPFSQQYRENIAAQFTDEKSVVVRTLGIRPWNDDYHYLVQPAESFKQWLAADWIKGVRQIYPPKRPKGPDEIPFSVVSGAPEKPRPEKRKK